MPKEPDQKISPTDRLLRELEAAEEDTIAFSLARAIKTTPLPKPKRMAIRPETRR